MANELRHGSVGTELTQAEWEGVGTHVLNSQASGDIIYASASDQLSRLAKATDGNLLELASGLPAWTSSPTIGSTSWGNANHAHAASNSGGTVAGSALSGSSLASGITSSSLTSVGTIATGVWQGTDVGVAYGGTGVSTLTDGGVLLGSGTSAVTAMAVLTDGQMIVGDGSTDPVAESGSTLRTSIGVGTGDSPQFTDLTLTDDLILNSDSAVFSMGDGADFSITHDGSTAATIDMGGAGGKLLNVGSSGSDWNAHRLGHRFERDGSYVDITCNNTSVAADSSARVNIQVDHVDSGDPLMQFVISGGETLAMGLDNSESDRFVMADDNSADLSSGNRLRLVIATGVLSVDGDGGGSDDPVSLFDAYDDAKELERYARSTADVPDITPEQRLANRQRLVEMGVCEWAKQEEGPDRMLIKVQPMTKLLAGGIYQTRHRMDSQYEEMNQRLTRIETALGV